MIELRREGPAVHCRGSVVRDGDVVRCATREEADGIIVQRAGGSWAEGDKAPSRAKKGAE